MYSDEQIGAIFRSKNINEILSNLLTAAIFLKLYYSYEQIQKLGVANVENKEQSAAIQRTLIHG